MTIQKILHHMHFFIILSLISFVKNDCQFNIGICIDNSASITKDIFEDQKNFLTIYYDNLYKEANTFIPAAAVLFGKSVDTKFTYHKYHTKSDVINGIKNIESNFEIGSSIGACMNEIYKMNKPNNFKNVILILTDGNEENFIEPSIQNISPTMIANGYLIYVAGFGYVNEDNMNSIVGGHSDRIIYAEGINELTEIADEVTDNICDIVNINCKNPPIIENSEDTSNCINKNVGDMCDIKCFNGYVKVGTNPICNENGIWINLPKCEMQCTIDINEINDENLLPGTCIDVSPGVNCNVECTNDTEQVGNDPICGDNGELIGIPSCENNKDSSFPWWAWIIIGLIIIGIVVSIICTIIFSKRKRSPSKELYFDNSFKFISGGEQAELFDPEILFMGN